MALQDDQLNRLCEWANDEGMRIWLPAQHKDLMVEFTYRVEGRWRKLALRSRKLLAGIAASFRRRLQMNRWEPITANKIPASVIRTSETRTYAGTVGGCVLCHRHRRVTTAGFAYADCANS
jgi:hypothetical protein